VYIAGDSITKRLSPGKMSNVKIRCNPGAKIDTINQHLNELKADEKQHLQSYDVCVLHAGTHDVSNGESVESSVQS